MDKIKKWTIFVIILIIFTFIYPYAESYVLRSKYTEFDTKRINNDIVHNEYIDLDIKEFNVGVNDGFVKGTVTKKLGQGLSYLVFTFIDEDGTVASRKFLNISDEKLPIGETEEFRISYYVKRVQDLKVSLAENMPSLKRPYFDEYEVLTASKENFENIRLEEEEYIARKERGEESGMLMKQLKGEEFPWFYVIIGRILSQAVLLP